MGFVSVVAVFVVCFCVVYWIFSKELQNVQKLNRRSLSVFSVFVLCFCVVCCVFSKVFKLIKSLGVVCGCC